MYASTVPVVSTPLEKVLLGEVEDPDGSLAALINSNEDGAAFDFLEGRYGHQLPHLRGLQMRTRHLQGMTVLKALPPVPAGHNPLECECDQCFAYMCGLIERHKLYYGRLPDTNMPMPSSVVAVPAAAATTAVVMAPVAGTPAMVTAATTSAAPGPTAVAGARASAPAPAPAPVQAAAAAAAAAPDTTAGATQTQVVVAPTTAAGIGSTVTTTGGQASTAVSQAPLHASQATSATTDVSQLITTARGPPPVPHSQGWAPPSSVGEPTCSATSNSAPTFSVTAAANATIITEANAPGAAAVTATGDEARKSPTAQV